MGASAIILTLPKSDCRSAFLGFAGGTHVDIPLVDAPAIMGFRIARDTVKFANYKRSRNHHDRFVGSTVCTVAPIKHAPSSHHYPIRIAVPLVLASPEERISTSYLWNAPAIMGYRIESVTHIDILLADAPAIMGFHIERDTVKFTNYKGAVTIASDLWARWLRQNDVF
ncbi:hypothetical protein MRX96_033945 [Rhipicephalus microplus]